MKIPANQLVYGVDISNHQGEITTGDVADLVARGAQFNVIRLNHDIPGASMLTLEQASASKAGGLVVLGYAWANWRKDPVEEANLAAALAKAAGMPIVWLDMEDAVPTGVDAVSWALSWVGIMHDHGLLVGYYTYSYWPANNNLHPGDFGGFPWWIANKPAQKIGPDLRLYPAMFVMGQQFNDGTFGNGKADDMDWFIFPQGWADALNGTAEDEMTEDQIRTIVRDEINKVAKTLGQGNYLSDMLGAMLRRMNAAGKSLDLDTKVPE